MPSLFGVNLVLPSHPFLPMRVRTLIVGFLGIHLLATLLAQLGATGLGIPPQDPLLVHVAYCLTFGGVSGWLLLKGQQMGISTAAIWGGWPRHYAWLPLFGLLVAQLLFSAGSTLLWFYGLFHLAPDYLTDLLESPAFVEPPASQMPVLFLAFQMVAIVIVAPIAEEFVFRGWIFQRWADQAGIPVGLLGSSVLFGLLHLNPIGLTVFGLIMTLLYLQTRSLIVPIVAHMFNNALAWTLQHLSSLSPAGSAQSPLTMSAVDWQVGLAYLALATPILVFFMVKQWPSGSSRLPYLQNLDPTLKQ
ncbi:MAG: CPBP family intramembrane glutamic endopeptidase [Cyanobacteriota bacterium]|nr:CPBP family intramembrane glutamic endopeptidase [Cyanobacteriota bacterium]